MNRLPQDSARRVCRRLLSTFAAVLLVACASDSSEHSYIQQVQCDVGQELCGDTCVVLSYNADHCGACFNACATGQVCSGGLCVAATDAPGTTLTGGGSGVLTGGSGGLALTGGNAGLLTGGLGGILTGGSSGLVTGGSAGLLAGGSGGVLTGGVGGLFTGGSGGILAGGAGGLLTGGTGGLLTGGTGGLLTGGTAGTLAGGTGGDLAGGTGGEANGGTGGVTDLPLFSFFVTSYEAIQRLSGSPDGFGGDLRYVEADGLTGADKICTEIAEYAMPGSGAKVWRAFLSTSAVNAIDRVGEGPWYDALGRLLAMTRADLLNERPAGADPAIVNDLPNEYGVPNHAPNPGEGEVDNHHFLTGSDAQGQLYGPDATCNDWTTTDTSAGRPRVGLSWPGGGNRSNWISQMDEAGCGAGVNLVQNGGGSPGSGVVGSGGGYGGFYCFALTP